MIGAPVGGDKPVVPCELKILGIMLSTWGSTRLEGTRANRHVWFVDTVNVANVRIAM